MQIINDQAQLLSIIQTATHSDEHKVFSEYEIPRKEKRALHGIVVRGRTGAPENMQFVPGHYNDQNKWVDDRFTTYLLFKNDAGNTESLRVNMWGAIARRAHKELKESSRTGTILLRGATISHYTEPYQGTVRCSANVNFESQYRPETLYEYSPKGSGFDGAQIVTGTTFEAMESAREQAEYADAPF